MFFHDGKCLDCGAAAPASRYGTLDDTLASPRTLAVLYHAWTEMYYSAEAAMAVARYGFGIKLGRTAVSNMINVGSDLLGPPAGDICGTMGVKQEDGEMDEAHYKMGVQVDGSGRGACGRRKRAGGCAAAGSGPAYSPRTDTRTRTMQMRRTSTTATRACPPLAVGPQARDQGGVHLRRMRLDARQRVRPSPTRTANVLKGRFADRVTARTATDGDSVYGICEIHQRDHVHELREAGRSRGPPATRTWPG